MAINLNRPVLVKGIGKGYFKTRTGDIVEILSGQSMKLDVQAEMAEQYGGDALFPKYTYIVKKTGKVDITVADFSLSQLQLSQTVNLDTTTATRMQRVVKTPADTSLGTGLTGVTNIVCMKADGTPVAVSTATTPAATEVKVTNTGTITWGSGLTAGNFTFYFASINTAAARVAMAKDAMPGVCEFNWMIVTEDEDGVKYQIDLYAKRVRGDGKFTLDFARDKASVPALGVTILDPGDDNNDFCVITVTELV